MLNSIKTKISLALLFTLFVQPVESVGAFQYSKETRNKIIENFKKNQYENIYNKENVLLNEDLNFFETQNKIGTFETIKDKAQSKTQELSVQKDVISARVLNLQETIAQMDADIATIEGDINSINRDIIQTTLSINETKQKITQLNIEIAENKKILLDYISHIYKKSNLIIADEGNKDVDSIKTILLSEGDLGEVLSDIHYSSILDVTGQILLDKHRNLIKDMFVKKLELEDAMENLRNLREEQVQKKQTQEEKKAFREKILEFTKGQESLFQEYIAQNQAVEKSLKMKILQNKLKLREQKKEVLKKYSCDYSSSQSAKILSDDIALDIDDKDTNCKVLNKILQNESDLTPLDVTQSNVLSWPILPTNGLSAYYKDPGYQDVVGSSHDAIDIRTPQGTDIVAPADGYITYLRPPVDGGYAYVALKHANGFITVYGHISEVLYKKYDFVKAGTVFAKSGWEPGTKGAGPMTSGPHLHMELFKDGENVDPLMYMDLTQLGDKKVPQVEKYIYKFYNDYKLRFGEEYTGWLSSRVKTFKLEGGTEVERQKYLLQTYATSDFNDWNMWVEESVDAGIDPSFMMCVWLAETSLGRALKTQYNIGNVGNTDSGGTYTFASPREWVYWMTKTFNNKYLSRYNSINELSRYGNQTGPIYASSPINWHNNLVRCLSALKWEQVPDDFKFRIEN